MNEILTPCILQSIIICCTAIIICVVIASVIKICVVEKRKKTLKIKDPKGSSLSGTYIFLSSVVVSIAIIIFSYSFYMEELVLDFMSLASALISIILAVITIIYSFVINGQTTGQIDKLISASENLLEVGESVEKATGLYKQTADGLRYNVSLLQDNIERILNRIEKKIDTMSGDETEYEATIALKEQNKFKDKIIKDFNKNNSNAGAVLIYLCSKIKETGRPCDLKEIFSEENVMYYLGYVIALNGIGFTAADVDFSTRTIKSVDIVEDLVKGAKQRFELEVDNDFMKEYKQKIDDHFAVK